MLDPPEPLSIQSLTSVHALISFLGSFFGSEFPQDFIDQQLNLLESVYDDEDSGESIRAVIDGIESVSVEEGQIVVKPRRKSSVTKTDVAEIEEHDAVDAIAWDETDVEDKTDDEEVWDEADDEDEQVWDETDDEDEQVWDETDEDEQDKEERIYYATSVEASRPKTDVASPSLRSGNISP